MTVKTYTKNPEKFEVLLYDGSNAEEVLAWCPLASVVEGDLIITTNEVPIVIPISSYIMKGAMGDFVPYTVEYWESEYSEIVGKT